MFAAIYNLADVFAIPSFQDNLSNTVLEAMACGTPVVGFDAGGIRDMIVDGETGFLALTGNTAALAEALREILSSPKTRDQMATRSREVAVGKFRQELQATRYRQLHRALTGKPKLPSPAPLSEVPSPRFSAAKERS